MGNGRKFLLCVGIITLTFNLSFAGELPKDVKSSHAMSGHETSIMPSQQKSLKKESDFYARQINQQEEIFRNASLMLGRGEEQLKHLDLILSKVESQLKLVDQILEKRNNLELISLIVTSFLALLAIYYAAKVYTATNSPRFMRPIEIPNLSKLYQHYIEPAGKYVTYDNLVFEMKGAPPEKNFFCVIQDVTAGGIKIHNIRDAAKAFEVGERAGGNLDVEGKAIFGPVCIKDLISMQSDSVVLQKYDDTNLHYLVEVKIGFKHTKPLWVTLINKGGELANWRISGKQTVHEYKLRMIYR